MICKNLCYALTRCMSVGFMYKSVTSLLPFLITVTSRKFIFAPGYSAINFIVE